MTQKLEFDENKVCHDVAIPRYPNITPYGEKNYHQDLTFAVYQRQAFVEGARWQFEQSQATIEKLKDQHAEENRNSGKFAQDQENRIAELENQFGVVAMKYSDIEAKDQEIHRLREALDKLMVFNVTNAEDTSKAAQYNGEIVKEIKGGG